MDSKGRVIPTKAGDPLQIPKESCRHQNRKNWLYHLGPVPDDPNDGILGAVTDDDEHGEVTLVNVNQLKDVANKLELGYKPLC